MNQPRMGITSTSAGAWLLLAALLMSATLDCAQTQGISKEDMCTSLRSLAKGWDGCTINSNCTCISCNVNIDQIGTVPISICIVDTCATPVCFDITAGTLFSRTVCRTINIEFSIKKTVKILFFRRTVTISVSVTVEIVRRPSSGIQMTISARIAPLPSIELASETLYLYCPPPPTTTLPPLTPTTKLLPSPLTPTCKPLPSPTVLTVNTTPTTDNLTAMPVPLCNRQQTQQSLETLAEKIGRRRNPTANCSMNESNFQLVCSFQYTKTSRRGKGVSLSANFSFTFEPCCPQMTVRLAIREISANVAPLVLSETFNETSSTSVSGSDSSSSMKVAVTMNKEKKTIRFMVTGKWNTVKIVWVKATKAKLFWVQPSCPTMATSLPTPLPTSMPTIPPQRGLEEMCASVQNLTSAFNTSDTLTGTCSISQNCLNVKCSIKLKMEGGMTIPVSLTVILLPCQSPFTIYVKAEINLFGQKISLADDNFSGNATIPVSIVFISGTVNMIIIQQDCGILLSVSGNFGSFGMFSLIENANIIMYCNTG